MKEIEEMISNLLLSVCPLFSSYQVWKFIDAQAKDKANAEANNEELKSSESTIKSHINRGKIPAKFFRTYIDAWSEKDKISQEFGNIGAFDREKQKEMRDTIIDFLYETVDLYEELLSLNCGICPERYQDLNATKPYSTLFSYRLNKNFDAFLTLNVDDLCFLAKFFKSDVQTREKIFAELDEVEQNRPRILLRKLTNEDGRYWIKARRSYSSTDEKYNSTCNYWELFCGKINDRIENVKLNGSNGIIDIPLLVLYNFVELIWPKPSQEDTTFGTREIDALIIFKFFLTESAKKLLLTKLEDIS